MYRQTDDRKVWYEWMVEVFALERTVEAPATDFIAPVMSGARGVSPSADGKPRQQKSGDQKGVRCVKVGMSDLHSSIKEGCLM
jgi:protein arginine N-methyltransferase 5